MKLHYFNQIREVWRALLSSIVFLIVLVSPTAAHEGPPFPVIVDQKVGPCIISVWTDPDVGTGTFFVIVEPPPGGTVPDDLKVEIGVQPINYRLPETRYIAQREGLRGQLQYKAEVQFDKQEFWRVRVLLESSQGSGETSVNVEATPPGYGRWDLILYALPFLGVGFLWFMAVMRKRSRKNKQ